MKLVSALSAASALLASSSVAAKDISKRELTMAPPPRREMYQELIYIEKDCRDYQYFPRNLGEVPFSFAIGDRQVFKCDLYEAAINFGQYGGNKVGETFWACKAIAFQDFVDPDNFLNEFEDVLLYDCTVTDYIGEGPNVDDDETYIRNEGGSQEETGVLVDLTPPYLCIPDFDGTVEGGDLDFNGLDCFPKVMRTDPGFDEFHSHTGIFATVGGTGLAKGARGQMEVEWDYYKMTWFHVYTIEVWALEQPPIPLYGSGHHY
jgi:hypothetical protein